ncbi:MAG: hypothetical protein ACRC8A_09895 [Microcoleaceae cyanobacterium]
MMGSGLWFVVGALRDFNMGQPAPLPVVLILKMFGLLWVLGTGCLLVVLVKGCQESIIFEKNSKKFQGSGQLLLSQYPLKLRDTCQIQFRRSLAVGNGLQQTGQLKVRLLCSEVVTYRVGTDNTTVRKIVLEQPLGGRFLPLGMQTIEHAATFTIPRNVAPSFQAENNRILWEIEAKIDLNSSALQKKNMKEDPWVQDGTLSTFAFAVDPEVAS